MESQFDTLVQILDEIRTDAPNHLNSVYRPARTQITQVQQARSRAYIHLYLLVKHGVLDFEERESYICDGEDDGGLDAYFMDHENKFRILIQSKFHVTGKRFEGEKMPIADLVKMEIDRILQGMKRTSYGEPYNAKVKKFQREIKKSERHLSNPSGFAGKRTAQ